jgi:hypothetical protein
MSEPYMDKVRMKARPHHSKEELASESQKAVESGRKVLIKHAVATNLTGETQRILIGVTKRMSGVPFDTTKTYPEPNFEGPILANSACDATDFPLGEGEVVGAVFEGVSEGDELLLTVVGEYIK